ncbi:hypothetical protein V495_02939 [Pseudogymnoascus sp. VKM F-4514 (FW-929)]|nr:hypothetical protein V495_02939 [Pseudogymnoascus sp. VKM F-4514 (FW-929)]KFY61175.1 hypothetical protein V497_03121 [Pseudogymnoascus sp. VKM F-4516 (FW-969)]
MGAAASLRLKRRGDQSPDSGQQSAWSIRVLRDTRRIGDLETRAETRKMARDEFELNKNVKDISQIKYLISTGKLQWDATERYIDGL